MQLGHAAASACTNAARTCSTLPEAELARSLVALLLNFATPSTLDIRAPAILGSASGPCTRRCGASSERVRQQSTPNFSGPAPPRSSKRSEDRPPPPRSPCGQPSRRFVPEPSDSFATRGAQLKRSGSPTANDVRCRAPRGMCCQPLRTTGVQARAPQRSARERFAELEELKVLGAVNEDEYQAKRAEILAAV